METALQILYGKACCDQGYNQHLYLWNTSMLTKTWSSLMGSSSLNTPWLSTRWMPGDFTPGTQHRHVYIPCIVVLLFTSGLCLVGFYHSHDKHKPRKRTKEFRNCLYDGDNPSLSHRVRLHRSREADIFHRCGVIL